MPRVHYIPLVDAIRAATGRKVHLSTALRWCIDGRAGQRLQSWMVGGRRLTTLASVEAFIDATTRASTPQPVALPPANLTAVSRQLDNELA